MNRPEPSAADAAGVCARRQAARIVQRWREQGAYPERELAGITDERGLTQELALGVARQWGALDFLLRQLAPRPPPPPAKAALLVGLYQLLFADGIPEYAALHTTVAAARALGGESAARLVNAVLRRVQRERADTQARLERAPPWIRGSHPESLWRRWAARYGAGVADRLCAWNNQPAAAIIRPAAGAGRDEFLRACAAAGLALAPHPAAPDRFFELPRGVAVPRVPGFAEGKFYAQDPATADAVALLAPRPGETVWDACAAPGGKTVLIAEALAGRGRLLATDSQSDRLHHLRENLRRMRPALAVETALAVLPDQLPTGAFDAVLLDVPCSNTGVLRRKPSARWRFTAAALRDAAALQGALLRAAARAVRPGGRLVYSTCSLEPEENEQQVYNWLRDHPEFRLDGEARRFPPVDGTDGAYAARLRRRA